MIEQFLESYLDGNCRLEQAFHGLSHELLHRIPADGTWTLHQNLVHLLDSDLIHSDRMKRVASMNLPLLIGYDETCFSQLPGSNLIAVEDAIDVFQKNRKATALILRSLPANAWERCGIHNEAGKLTLREIAEGTVEHLEHHLRVVAKKKASFQG